MIFLALSIVAAIILVGIAIRRLPYLRTHRPGLEISTPRPYLQGINSWQSGWYKLVEWFGSLRGRTAFRLVRPQMPQFPRRTLAHSDSNGALSDADADLLKTAHPDGSFSDEPIEPVSETGANDHPFWREDDSKETPELPVKGLVTRRGEAQKIAHELATQADAAFRKQNYKEAEKYYLQAASNDPDNARIYNRLGVIYLRTKNYKDAVEAFRGSIKFDDRVASRHYNLALAYLGKKDYRSAQKAIEEAIRLEPTNDKYRQTHEALSQ